MSIQHKSRIKSVADYSSNITSVGACCYARASGPVEEFYNTCVANGGHWKPFKDVVDEVSCPELGATGCCCSCSYVSDFAGATGFFEAYAPSTGRCHNQDNTEGTLLYPCYQGGLQDNITFCECSDKGGVWAQGVSCGVYTEPIPRDGNIPEYIEIGAHILCTRNNNIEDVRWPGACCSGITCDDACSIKECATFGDGHGATGIQFWPDNYCRMRDGDNDIVINCGSEAYNFEGEDRWFERDKRTNILVAKGLFSEIMNEQESSSPRLKSSCSYLQKTNTSSKELVCSNETKGDCNNKQGIWAGYNKDNQQISCSNSVTTDIQNYMTNQKKISRSIISSWKLGDRVLGQGRFVGEFILKDSIHGVGSECFGSETTGTSYAYYAKNEDNTKNSNKTYALIISDRDFGGRPLPYESDSSVPNIKKSSVWDAHYNTSYNNTKLMNNINKSYNKNIWWNKIIPSKDMLSFIFNQTNKLEFILNTTVDDKNKNHPFTPMIQSNAVFYWTSTFLTDIAYKGETQLALCQSLGDDSMVVYSPRNKEHAVRVVEAIEIIE